MPIKPIPKGTDKSKKDFQEKEDKSLVSKRTLMGPKSGQHSKKKDLANKSTLMGPNFGWNRILMGRIANINAIPDTIPSMPIGGGGMIPLTPNQTQELELVTQNADTIMTQADEYLIAQQQ